MGSILGSALANAFLLYHEKNWIERFPLKYRPFFYRKYVDGIFVLLNSPENLKVFSNSCHVNIHSTIEKRNRMTTECSLLM